MIVLLLGLAIAGVVVGFGRAAGPTARGGSSAVNGRIAVSDGSRTLEIVNPDGSEVQAIHCPRAVAICGIFEPAWSPDGARLAFVRGRPFPDAAMSVYVRNRAGAARKLADCGECGNQHGNRLEWSPDGTQIVFNRDMPSAGTYQSMLWIADTRTGGLRQLTECGSNCADVHPDWSPNGELIIFSRLSRDGASLYTVHPDGSGLTELELETPWAFHPMWSPNGQKIAFDGADKVFVAAADGSQPKLLVDGARGSGPGVPSWSPDGTRLAYFSTPGTPGRFTAEVWTINPDGSHTQRLAAAACCVGFWAPPVWSPDGKQIAFAANNAGGTYVVNATGGGLHGISMLNAGALSWQPR